MKKLLSAFAVSTALTGAAAAADLPRRVAPPVIAPIPVFTWTGFYAGFNAGYGFDARNDNGPQFVATVNPLVVVGPLPVNAGLFAFRDRATEGFVGGGQIGYNYQFTPGSGFVVGIEADAQYVDFGRDRNNFAFAPLTIGAGVNPAARVFNPNGLSGLDFFGTVRGRIGYAFDRVLFYGTGGFAYGSGGGTNFGLPNNDDFRTGWTAGGGVEYALPTDSFLNFFRSSAVTVKVEALYVNLDRNSLNGAFAVNGATVVNAALPFSIAVPGVFNRRNDEFVVVRAGVNYKFGTW
ncbi:MAG: porin family protein [Methylobacterium sp.]|uniref:outer membrane protein n=1 Tax=Methylobacterium sp. TaxID=409 RepID=UPI00258E139D|nr:porin family protein [Methylobacterium sp.]MBY0296267.1 porin family protein [Methylobacterium sp.]